tara:strand:- start:321 stop:530 length:210 start_codon:yes stop_codon:yes gene_type:complete
VLDSYFLITKNKPKTGLSIAMRDGLEVKLELLRCNEIEGIQVGKKLSKNTTKGDQELNLFTTKNGTPNY